MPRLIPRLLDALAKSANKLTTAVPAPAQNRRQSAKFKSRVKTEPLIRPSLSADGRTHSILADDVNPIIHPSAFTRHKLPTPRTGRRASGTNVHAMNIEERAWSASPYCMCPRFYESVGHQRTFFQCACWEVRYDRTNLRTDTCLVVRIYFSTSSC
jgi:hypothetical protein